VNHVRGNCRRDPANGVCSCRTEGPTPTITLGHCPAGLTPTPSFKSVQPCGYPPLPTPRDPVTYRRELPTRSRIWTAAGSS
jgi:hypothetical protein